MRKKKVVLFAVLCLLCSAILFFGAGVGGEGGAMALTSSGEPLVVLVAGLDEAAGNTDVMMLVSLDPGRHEITVLQLPRDTYFDAPTPQGKLNQLYPTYRARGLGSDDALLALSSELSTTFDLAIDHFVAVDISAVSQLVDELGGVTVDLPAPIGYREGETYIELPAGKRTLTGEEAVRFIRFRSGYVEGDLGRVDAQKLLLMASYHKVKDELSFSTLASVLPRIYSQISTDMPLSEQIAYVYSFWRDRSEYSVRLMTLPGEAVRADGDAGLWYYVVNRAAAAEVLSRYFGSGAAFDAAKRLVDDGRDSFSNIYYDKAYSYSVYTEDTIDELRVKTK